ncbi:MAG TPA: tRNA epoxyqueuosine(34) reductase QueG [Myxococcales bacterium]
MLRADDVLQASREAGFHLAGLARAEALDGAPLDRWLQRGMAASMSPWMAERRAQRLDPRVLLPGAKTVLALGCCVRHRGQIPSSPIARYAQGRDYHATMRDRLRALRRGLAKLSPPPKDYAEADTGPVLEKIWAQRAGLGWLGKNGLLIAPGHGSHVVLAVMVLDAEVDRYAEPAPEHCGRCTACLAGCPTKAIVEPGVVDSRLCLSYQTIEDHGPYAENLREHGRWAFGCDACQDACPWNKADHACDDPRFEPRPVASLSMVDLALLDRTRFVELTRGTAVARARFEGLRRNAAVVLGARRDAECPRLSPLLSDPDESVREAARWALERASAR